MAVISALCAARVRQPVPSPRRSDQRARGRDRVVMSITPQRLMRDQVLRRDAAACSLRGALVDPSLLELPCSTFAGKLDERAPSGTTGCTLAAWRSPSG